MRTSHIYQPVMLIELLKNNGKRTVTDIAKAFVNRDPTQVEYYSNIVKNMVGKVLTNNRGVTYKDGDTYHLDVESPRGGVRHVIAGKGTY